jgi:hypothetical protein
VPSPRYVSLRAKVDEYAALFISDKDDMDATQDDHVLAVAFRVLASGAIEEYVEERCKQVARTGMDRLRKGQATTTGRALVVWAVSRNQPGCIPIHQTDIGDHYDEYDDVLKAYLSSVAGNHGMNSKDLRNLVNPVGLRAHHLPSSLLDKLQALSQRRDPVVHTAVTKKATGRLGPRLEKQQVYDVVELLESVDEALGEVCEKYPLVAGP